MDLQYKNVGKKREMLMKERTIMQEENHGISLKPLRALTKKKF